MSSHVMRAAMLDVTNSTSDSKLRVTTGTLPQSRDARMRTLKAGVLYFAVVFGAAFVLGPIRIVCGSYRGSAREWQNSWKCPSCS
jgi:hypothetical protein